MASMLQEGNHTGAIAALATAPKLNARMINMGFTAKVANGSSIEGAATEMLRACAENGIPATAAMHNNVLTQIAKQGPPEAVLSWLSRMRASKIEIDRVACNIQLKAHASMGDLTACVDYLASMMRGARGGPPTPDAISFNTVIHALASAPGYADKAEKLLTTMLDGGFEADTRSFTGVILAFARASRPGPAAKWLERMLQRNVQPDTTTFNAVLLAYANAADVDGAFHVYKVVEETVKDECPNAQPDVVSFNTLIQAAARAGRPQKAEEAFKKMERIGLAPTNVTYTSVLIAYALSGNPPQAQAWLDAMISRGLQPDAQTTTRYARRTRAWVMPRRRWLASTL